MIHQLLDYETLRLIWWALLGILLIGFAIMDGFDMGVAMLLPFTAKTDIERRIAINSIAPVWEGNQIWLILGAGAIFAAWPLVYAVAFSGFYLAMFFVLMALILRPVGMKYRSKISDLTWRSWWDKALFIGGFVPSLVFGIAFGNILQGVPFYFDESLRIFYTGTFLNLFTPFPLICGVLSVSMFTMHGATYLAIKTHDPIAIRAKVAGVRAALLTMIFFTLGWLWIKNGWVQGYRILEFSGSMAPSNPLFKSVVREPGAWLYNYSFYPWTKVAPLLGYGGALLAAILLFIKSSPLTHKMAFISSAFAQVGIIATAGVSIFPFILPSSSHFRSSLTVWDASSSHMTLFLMLIAVIIFLPLVLLYTAWVFRIIRGKVTEDSVLKDSQSY